MCCCMYVSCVCMCFCIYLLLYPEMRVLPIFLQINSVKVNFFHIVFFHFKEYAADVQRFGVCIFVLFCFKTEMDTLEPFFVLLRSFIQSCPINQEALLHNDGIAALGVILQKV